MEIRREHALPHRERGTLYSDFRGRNERAGWWNFSEHPPGPSRKEVPIPLPWCWAFGWNQEGKDQTPYKAPLILLRSICLAKQLRAGFALALHEDEPRFNLTLLEMLRQDSGCLTNHGGRATRDDSGTGCRRHLAPVATAIKDRPQEEVTEEVCLGTVLFCQYLIGKDLADHPSNYEKIRSCAISSIPPINSTASTRDL